MPGKPARRTGGAGCFLVCCDTDSLGQFVQVIAAGHGADVFHQTSRFELRARRRRARLTQTLSNVVCDAGALPANRFVLGFDLPRFLNRSQAASRMKRTLRSGVYAHVTGHGLCVRLSLLGQLPFPARSPLEDMHHSFILGSRGAPMIPIASLDCAEVPDTVPQQIGRAARWFFRPGRFTRYLRDPPPSAGLALY